MSDGNKSGGKPAAKQKKTKAEKATPSSSIRTGSVVTARPDRDRPAERFTYVLGPQHEAVRNYLKCIFEPDLYQFPVPSTRGSFELLTKLWKTEESGTFIAGLDGNALLGVGAANWVEDGNIDGQPNVNSQLLGWGVMGTASVASANAGVSYTGFPFEGVAQLPANYKSSTLDVPTDYALQSTTRLRLVAMKLSVHSVMSQNSAKGELMLAATVNPLGGVGGGSINGANWDQLDKTNDGVMTTAVRTVANWKSGDVFSVVALPSEQQAFEMVNLPQYAATRNYTDGGGSIVFKAPIFHLACAARSMTPGDAISYKITYVWESELSKTNESNPRPVRPSGVPQSTVDLALTKSRPYAAHAALSGIHDLPFIETLATTDPMAMMALSKHPKIPPELQRTGPQPVLEVVRPHVEGPSFLGKIATLAKNVVHGAAGSASLAKIPYVGGILSGLAGALDSVFGN